MKKLLAFVKIKSWTSQWPGPLVSRWGDLPGESTLTTTYSSFCKLKVLPLFNNKKKDECQNQFYCFVFVYSYYSETSDQISINGWSLVLVSVSGWSGQCCCYWGPLCNSGQCNGVHYMLYRCNTVHQALSQDINITALTFPQNNFIDTFSWLFYVE